VRLYAGVVRFFVIVVLAHIAMFALVGALASRSRGEAIPTNTVRLAGSSLQVRTLDPVGMGDTSSTSIGDQIYEGLVSYDQETLAVVPSLSDRWTVSPDGTTYTFHIRPGVRFIDDPCFPGGKGREVVASDFVFNFTRMADPVAAGTGFWLVDGRVVGATEYNEGRSKLIEATPRLWEIDSILEGTRGIPGYSAPAPDTFQIRLERPFAPFLKVLAMAYFRVAAPEAVERYGPARNAPGRDTFFSHPVGTGPFMLWRWEPDVEVLLRRNPGYWDRDDRGRQLPYVDAVRTVSRRDPHTAFMEFEEGAADIAGVPDQDWDRVMTPDKRLKPAYEKRFVLETAPILTTQYYGFDMSQPPFGGNKKLRQALNYAVDRESIIKQIGRGIGSPAYGPIPQGLPGHDPSNQRYRYDPEKAKQLLAEAGYPDGEGLGEIVLYVSGVGDVADRNSVALMEQFRRVGVHIRLKQQPWPLHLEAIDRREPRFFSLGWVADYPDAENFLALFTTRNHTPGPNATLYSSAEFDRLYDQAMAELDEGRRTELYRQAADIVIDDCPWLFVTHGESLSLRQPWVTNFPPNPLGVYFYKNLILKGREQTRAGSTG